MWVMESNGPSRMKNLFEPRRHEDTKRFSIEENRFVTSCLRGLIILICVLRTARADQNDPAKHVVERLLGDRASSFSYEEIPADDGKDVYEIEASNGKVIIRGNTP